MFLRWQVATDEVNPLILPATPHLSSTTLDVPQSRPVVHLRIQGTVHLQLTSADPQLTEAVFRSRALLNQSITQSKSLLNIWDGAIHGAQPDQTDDSQSENALGVNALSIGQRLTSHFQLQAQNWQSEKCPFRAS